MPNATADINGALGTAIQANIQAGSVTKGNQGNVLNGPQLFGRRSFAPLECVGNDTVWTGDVVDTVRRRGVRQWNGNSRFLSQLLVSLRTTRSVAQKLTSRCGAPRHSTTLAIRRGREGPTIARPLANFTSSFSRGSVPELS